MTIKIYLKQKGKSLKAVILEDVRSVGTDGEFYRVRELRQSLGDRVRV